MVFKDMTTDLQWYGDPRLQALCGRLVWRMCSCIEVTAGLHARNSEGNLLALDGALQRRIRRLKFPN